MIDCHAPRTAQIIVHPVNLLLSQFGTKLPVGVTSFELAELHKMSDIGEIVLTSEQIPIII